MHFVVVAASVIASLRLFSQCTRLPSRSSESVRIGSHGYWPLLVSEKEKSKVNVMDEKNLSVLMTLKERMADETEKSQIKPGVISAQALLSLMTDVSISLHGQPKDARRPKKKKTSKSPVVKTPRAEVNAKASRTRSSTPWPSSEVFQGSLVQKNPVSPDSAFGIKPVHAPSKTSKSKGGRCMFRGVSVSQALHKSLKESLALLIYGNDHKFLKRKFDALSFYLAQAKDDYEAAAVYEKIAKMLISGKTDRSVSEVDRDRRNALIKADVARTIKSLEPRCRVVDKDAPEWNKRHCQVCRAEFFTHRDWISPPSKCKKCHDSYSDAKAAKVSKNRKSGRTFYSHYVIFSVGSPGLGKRH